MIKSVWQQQQKRFLASSPKLVTMKRNPPVEALLISLRRYDGLMEVLLAADRVAEPPAMPKDNAKSRKCHGWAGNENAYDSASLQPQTAA